MDKALNARFLVQILAERQACNEQKLYWMVVLCEESIRLRLDRLGGLMGEW